MKKIGLLFLLIPFVVSTWEVQTFVTKFISMSHGQMLAYVNVILVIIGLIIYFRQRQPFSSIINLWLLFFLLYYFIGAIASIIHNTPVTLLSALLPLIYFLSFSVFLSFPDHHKLFITTVIIAFSVATLLLIVFHRFNFSLDYSGIYTYDLERAEGVYGDANQAALGGLLTFVFISYFFKAQTKLQTVLKFLLMAISIYAVILTFSKTGFIVLLVVFGLNFYRYFTPKRVLISLSVVPFLLLFTTNTNINGVGLTVDQNRRIEDIVNILTFNTERVDFSERDVLLQNMLNYVYDNPILGYGIAFSNLIEGHNTIIGVWADAGIIPFLLFLFILYQYFIKSWNAPIEKRYFALSVIFILAIFMLSLQTVINQPYLLAIFAFLGYFLETPETTIDS